MNNTINYRTYSQQHIVQRTPQNVVAPSFERLPGTGQIVEGSDAHFECRVRGAPQPEVVWSRLGVPMVQDDR